MADLNVRLERLPRMWVASMRVVGEAPEAEAWRSLRDWASRKGLWSDPARHPVFGFNNPSPSPGSKEYGYELWIRVDGPEEGHAAVTFKEFEGGLFAVTGCRLTGDPGIAASWRMLWDWAQAGPNRWRRSQELEKVLNPEAAEDEMIVELYLPVAE
jgi:AraC family transcriptional regulator